MTWPSNRPNDRCLWLAIGFAVLAVVFCAYAILSATRNLGAWTLLPAVATLWAATVAYGHWRERIWAPLVGIAGFSLLIAGAIFVWSQGARSSWAWGLMAFCAWEIAIEWSVWRKLKQGPVRRTGTDDDPPIMLVLLLREPQYLDAQLLANLVARAWDVSAEAVAADAPDEEETAGDSESAQEVEKVSVLGDSPQFFCYGPNAFFLVQNFDEPYFEKPEEVAEDITELRRREAVVQHRAWLGVAMLGTTPEEEAAVEGYRRIARLLAEIADDNTLALLDPHTGSLFLYDPETDEKLRGPDPRSALRESYYVPVIQIGAEDEAMQQAVAEAHTRWPEFVAAFETRSDDAMFSVKAPFSDGKSTEFMWVHVTGIENDIVYGTLDNDPVNVRSVQAGGRVRVKVGDLNDWYFKQGERTGGGFTIKVLTDRFRRDGK